MRFHRVQALLVFGLAVAQDLFAKENKFLAQHGLTMQAMKPKNANLTAEVGHDWWVFQITLRSNPMLCMDLTGENDENGTPIGIWECNGHESQLWYFDGGTYQINWAGNSQKCLDGGDLQSGNPLIIWDCNGQDAQTWSYDSDLGTIYLVNSASDASLCLDVPGGDLSQGNQLQVWQCNLGDGQQFNLQAGITIRSFQNYQMCVDLPGGDTTDGTNLWLWECNGGWGQYWIFDTDDNNAIKFAADLSKCIDAGATQAGSTLMIWDCNGLPSQSFGYDADSFTLYSSWSSQSDASLCVDLAGGALGKGAAIDLWDCNNCWNQQFQAWGPSSAVARSTRTLGDVVAPLFSRRQAPTASLAVADGDCPPVPSPSPSPPSPTPSPDIPSNVFMPDCNLAAPGWPTFNSQSDLQADSEWSHYFQTVYGEVPSSGYPICAGAFMQVPRRGGLTSFSAQSCHGKTLSSDGALVDRMSDCCDAPNVNFIYNSRNTRHAVPDNTWFEGMHITESGEKGAAWYYQAFGSAIWVYTGTTKVFKDHPEATSYFLQSSCNDQNHKSKPATECENDFTKWFKQAKSQGLKSLQFTEHFDCGCGEQGTSSWDGHNRLCYTEIIDIDGDGSKGCASGFYKAGWAAANDCDCDGSKQYANCKGYGLG